MPGIPSAAGLARQAKQTLKSSGDESTASRSRSYFKPEEEVSFYGVRTPRLREIEKELYRQVRDRWPVEEAVRFAERMVRDRHLEARLLGLLLVGRFRNSFSPVLLERTRWWLLEGFCSNWAATDTLCAHVLSPLLDDFPLLSKDLRTWTASANLWVRRASAVALVPIARRGRQLALAYEIAESLLDDREDLVHKATGWLLREAGRSDPSRLKSFLMDHGTAIPRTALRYAIEHFPERERKRILSATRKS